MVRPLFFQGTTAGILCERPPERVGIPIRSRFALLSPPASPSMRGPGPNIDFESSIKPIKQPIKR
eukprot:4070277-Pyramimonas_sp.AAC.1